RGARTAGPRRLRPRPGREGAAARGRRPALGAAGPRAALADAARPRLAPARGAAGSGALPPRARRGTRLRRPDAQGTPPPLPRFQAWPVLALPLHSPSDFEWLRGGPLLRRIEALKLGDFGDASVLVLASPLLGNLRRLHLDGPDWEALREVWDRTGLTTRL